MRKAILLTLLVLVTATAWGGVVPGPTSSVPAGAAALSPSKSADLTPAPRFTSTCQVSVICRYPYNGYLHCEGDSYCDSGDTWVECDDQLQECPCGLMPPNYCP
jgi:hypothetical protein